MLDFGRTRISVPNAMSDHHYYYSMVVDGHPPHAYEAETLLFTLGEFARVPRERIVVQCTDRVSDQVANEFTRNGFRVVRILPYLDGKYCNKIAQLDYFVQEDPADVDGVFLLDLDFVVLAPVDVEQRDCVWGKIVDGANPPLHVLERIFLEAGVGISSIVPCDWETGDTVATNLNGGFLYLPLPLAAPMRSAWRKWAEFLYERPELFETPAQRNNTDQIAFALALASEKFPLRYLSANWNFPAHRPEMPRSFRPELPIRGVHYHRCLDTFGLIEPAFKASPVVDEAVSRANATIGAQDPSMFFERYKRHLAREAVKRVPEKKALTFSDAFVARTWIGDRKRRLVLHAGTPKTGTTALQWHLASNRKELAERGFWYPAHSKYTREPKHQEIVDHLRQANGAALRDYIENALREMPDDTHTIVFTTEGVFNHWWDYAPRTKGWLRQIANLFDFELCVWFREPESFAAALYVQYLKNGPVDDVMRNVYGKDISCTDALRDEWFRRHLDYLGFVLEGQELFGAGRVKAFVSKGDTVHTFRARYGLDMLPAPDSKRRNATWGAPAVRMLRSLNRSGLERPSRRRRMALIEKVDWVFGRWAEKFRLNERERMLVWQCARRGWRMARRDAL